MAYRSDMDDLIPDMAAIDGVKSVTRGWPGHAERLPCVAVNETVRLSGLHYEDRAYLETLLIDVRVFALSDAEKDRIAFAIDGVMDGTPYQLISVENEDNAGARVKRLQYQRGA